MNTTCIDLLDTFSERCHQVETHGQSLVDAGTAQWGGNGDGDTELRMDSGETCLFGGWGVTRLR